MISIISELLLSSLERSITLPKEDSLDREARRKRAAQGVGLSQMEMIVEGESSKGHGAAHVPEERSNPFRFEKCISTRTSDGNVKNVHGKEKNISSKIPLGQSFLIEAMERINEPLQYLVASCVAVSTLAPVDINNFNDNEQNGEDTISRSSEISKVIFRIRRQLACCTDIQEHLKWIKLNKMIFDIKDNSKRAKEMAISKLATLMLVSAVADALINSCELKGEKGLVANAVFVMDGNEMSDVAKDIEGLFTLRTDASEEAAALMSSFVVKPKKEASSSKNKETKKKVLKDVNVNSSSQSSEQPAATKTGKTLSLTKLKSSDINHATLAKNRKFIENVLGNTCPANNQDFLAGSLRKFGVEKSMKVSP